MSEESERHGESSASPGAARVVLSAQQFDAASETLRAAWASQDSYIDHLETLNKQLEGIYDSYIGLVAPRSACAPPASCLCANIT